MTTTEFLTLVASGVSTQEVMKEAECRLAEHRAKIERRKQTPMTETQKENEELCNKIMGIIGNRVMPVLDIARELGVTTQKASALCKLLVSRELLISRAISVNEKWLTVYMKK